MGQGLLHEVLIARQPILTAEFGVVGYELLHRDVEGFSPLEASGGAGHRASASIVVDGLLGLGLSELTAGDDAWINVPPEMLHADAFLDVPPDGLVLEVLDGPRALADLPAALRRHRAAGFRLALDAVIPDDARLGLADEVDVVKVDLLASGTDEGLRLIARLAAAGHPVLAEKVEDLEVFERAAAAGATLFQGYFFTRPLAVRGMRPLGIEAGHLELLQRLADVEVDLGAVEDLIRRDVTLSDRFLRLVRARSATHEVESIRHGLVLLGLRAVQRWVNLLVLAATVRDAPSELVAVASARARGCELLEELRGGTRRLEAFSLGMFSVLGADGRLPETTLSGLPVSDDVREALEQGRGRFRPLLEIVLALERADWERLVSVGRSIGIEPRQLAHVHTEALRWSAGLRRATAAPTTDPAQVRTGLAARSHTASRPGTVR